MRKAAATDSLPLTTIPVYQQVANVLRTQITAADVDRPSRLPNEEQLAKVHNVARGTVRQALQVLTQEGLIERTRGRGTVTVPAGILAWRKIHKSRAIVAISSWQIDPDVPANFYGQIYQGILVASREAGYRVRLSRMGGHFPEIRPHIQPENPEQTVGVILVGLADERIIRMHTEGGYPVVCTDYWPSNPRADAVVFDCFGEGQMAVEHLLSQGHRHIFYLGNNLRDEKGRERHECDADLMEAGCRRALQEAGLALPARHVYYCTHGGVERAVEWYVGLRPRPTAGVIFGSDGLERFIRGLARHGLRCPEDVSLICKATVTQALNATTVRNDPFRMGHYAVELLLERASGKRRVGLRLAIESALHRGVTVRHLQS